MIKEIHSDTDHITVGRDGVGRHKDPSSAVEDPRVINLFSVVSNILQSLRLRRSSTTKGVPSPPTKSQG